MLAAAFDNGGAIGPASSPSPSPPPRCGILSLILDASIDPRRIVAELVAYQ